MTVVLFAKEYKLNNYNSGTGHVAIRLLCKSLTPMKDA